MSTQSIVLRVARYKQGDPAPHMEEFTVEADRRTTILTALQEIRRTLDRTLALRHSCHHASCGTCGMVVNGREVLACVTPALEEAAGRAAVTVEPMQNAPLLTDLVVDMDPFYEKYNAAGMAYLRRSEHLAAADLPTGLAAFTRFENCLECGLCVSTCPIMGSDPTYLGPAALAAANRALEEPRDRDAAAVFRLVDRQAGCWRCHVAMECTAVCPSNVDPAGGIMALRQKVLRRRFGRLFKKAAD